MFGASVHIEPWKSIRRPPFIDVEQGGPLPLEIHAAVADAQDRCRRRHKENGLDHTVDDTLRKASHYCDIEEARPFPPR